MYLTELRCASLKGMVPCESAEASVPGMSDRLQASSCLEMVAATTQVLLLLLSKAEMPCGRRKTQGFVDSAAAELAACNTLARSSARQNQRPALLRVSAWLRNRAK